MRLVIGGCAQGKLSYVMDRYGMQESCVMDGVLEMTCVSQDKVIVNHFHQWVKSCMEHEENPEQLIEEFLEKNQDCIIISDEVGNGIVPMAPLSYQHPASCPQ